jgi:hypothetical protein
MRTEIIPVPVATSSINETFDDVADLLLSSRNHADAVEILDFVVTDENLISHGRSERHREAGLTRRVCLSSGT